MAARELICFFFFSRGRSARGRVIELGAVTELTTALFVSPWLTTDARGLLGLC